MNTEPATEFVVTECHAHGVKVASDYTSFEEYVRVAYEDDYGWMFDTVNHTIARLPHAAAWDAANGCEPWRCCVDMIIDPASLTI
jgi:hypothetical protein